MDQIYRLLPCSIYDIAATETWLSDMARRGWYLQKAGRHYFRFQKGPASDCRYRLEPAAGPDSVPDCSTEEFYANAGWIYTATADRAFYIWRTIRPDAQELHSDPIVQSSAYEHLCRRLIRNAVAVTLSAILFFAFLLYIVTSSSHPVTLFLASPAIWLFSVLELFLVIQIILQAVKILRLKHSLAAGMSASHFKNYKKGLWLRRTLYYGYQILSLLILTSGLYMYTSASCSTIGDIDTVLPYLPLDVIEQNPAFSWHKDTYIHNGADAFSRASYSWSPLVPVHYDIYQQGEPRSIWKDNRQAADSIAVEPSAKTEYFQLAFPSLAMPLLQEMINERTRHSRHAIVTEHSQPGLDRTVIAKTDGRTQLFAVRGRQVIYISYYGKADLTKRLNLLADALENTSGDVQQ